MREPWRMDEENVRDMERRMGVEGRRTEDEGRTWDGGQAQGDSL